MKSSLLGLVLLLLAQLGCAAQTAPRIAARAELPAPDVRADSEQVAVGTARAASPSELRLVQNLMRETEALRGLKFKSEVQVTIEDRVAMRAYVERAIDDVQLARATRRYLALGALDPRTDVRALLVSVMEEELIGYYDPIEKRLAVRNDIARALGSEPVHDERSLTWRATVVHELVHALQDQHFALGESIKRARSTDAENAFGALVEGEATLVMLAYTAAQAGSSLAALTHHPEQIRSIMTRTPEQFTGALRRAPALLREPLLFRYREGAHFCAELYRSHGWTGVDRAHAAPPEATASIRHAARYLAGEREPNLAVPTIEQLGAARFVHIDEDVLGALELSVMLGGAQLDAEEVVAEWRGDRYAVFEKAGHLASVWWLRFHTTTGARKVSHAFDRLADGARRTAQNGNFVLVTRGLDDASTVAADAWFRHASTPVRRAAQVRKRAQRPLHLGDPLASAMHRH